MRPLVSVRNALSDEGLLALALPGPTWQAWRIVLMAAMGEPLTDVELEVFSALSGRQTSPTAPVKEMAAVVGRRGGKSRALSTIAVYIAALCDHGESLSSGERGLVLLLAPNQKQSRVALDYCHGVLAESADLSHLLMDRTADALRLANGIDIEVRAANFRQLRGVTCVAVLADESAFFSYDVGGAANPDTEIFNALRPTLLTTRGPLLIASSPYRKLGALWDLYSQHYGSEDDAVLIVKGSSRTFNRSLDQKAIERAIQRDPASARAEYLGEFRDDIEGYVPREVVEACVEAGIRERPPGHKRYCAFVDPAGGSGSDAMTLCVAHIEGDLVIIDAVRAARPPFSPEATISEFAALLRRYRLSAVTGDRYGGEYPRELFRKSGIRYELSELSKSQIYIDTLPRLNSTTVRLLDNPVLISELCGLERRHGRTGRDVIDHAPRQHDDVANATMGACWLAAQPRRAAMVGVTGADGTIRWNHETGNHTRSWQRRTVDEQGNGNPPRRYA